MTTKKRTISVRLHEEAKRRVEQAAKLCRQSAGAFLERAGEEQARQVLLAWVVARHRSGEASFSELAEETGLAVEEIMGAMAAEGKQEGLDLFLAICRNVADSTDNPEFFRLAEEAAKLVSAEDR